MKVLTLKIGEKTYTTGKITAFMSKEAIKINKDSLELAKLGRELQSEQSNVDDIVEKTDNLLSKLDELNSRKSWLICQVYAEKFSTDELENSLSSEEIDDEIQRIIWGITGIITKN